MSISAFLCSFWSLDSDEKQISTAMFLVFVVTFALFWFRPKVRRPSLPPGPRGLPLVGYLPFLLRNVHRTFADLAEIYGPVFKVRIGNKLCVVLNSPSSINEAFRHHETVFPNRDTTLRRLRHCLHPGRHDWKKLRKIFVRKMLSRSFLDASYSVRRQEVRKVIKGVFESAGTPIDIGKVGFLATMKSVLAMTWGDSGRLIGEDGIDLDVKFRAVMDELAVLLGTPNLSDIFPILGRFDLQGIASRTNKAMRVCDEILNTAIEEQRKMGGNAVGPNQQVGGKIYLDDPPEFSHKE
ncbi:Ferruginol synthase, partial [Cucurbita argyrosperma subsp. argyrosperma]